MSVVRHPPWSALRTLQWTAACRRWRHAAGITTASGAERACELVRRPFDHVIELLVALRELCHHDGVDRLIVDLRADFRSRRTPGERGHLVAARRIGVRRAERRLDLLPGLEVVQALER